MVMGESGLFGKANKAKEETNKIRESYLTEESYLNKEIELKSTDKWEN